ncbi:DUF4230 domain-containing protein [Fluviicola taffensis]|uniref:DUF4230 domain-containing protein n=1 Tax=Fluviicola taffensis (strain DSM 16823 / NCIMB 13979 / RW262) TaxID=755732 RepID=F2IIW4_FLUTR|nr:DUF4230 domain-containing protein [Fluviicola taffensis]AEA42821.1 hypothetical protein Fluta_0818 [Fluviicola taffensis DSM 16823]
MKNWFVLSLVFLLLTSCGDENEVQQTEVYQIRSIGTLSTTEYTLGKIIKWNDEGEWYKFGDRKILLSCKATVKAGVNLNSIKDSDIQIEGKKITIQLPPPEIVSFVMNPDLIRTEMTDVSGFRSDFSQVDKSKVLQKGEESIRKDLRKLNILNEAERNAKTFITDFYKNLGFEQVIVHETPKDKRNTNIDR